MPKKLTPYQWLVQNSYSEQSLMRNINYLVAKGHIDEGDAYDYYRDLRHQVMNEASFSFYGYN